MKEGKVVKGYVINILGVIKSSMFKEFPTEIEMKETVSTYFPTFNVEGDPVTWVVEEVYYLDYE